MTFNGREASEVFGGTNDTSLPPENNPLALSGKSLAGWYIHALENPMS